MAQGKQAVVDLLVKARADAGSIKSVFTNLQKDLDKYSLSPALTKEFEQAFKGLDNTLARYEKALSRIEQSGDVGKSFSYLSNVSSDLQSSLQKIVRLMGQTSEIDFMGSIDPQTLAPFQKAIADAKQKLTEAKDEAAKIGQTIKDFSIKGEKFDFSALTRGIKQQDATEIAKGFDSLKQQVTGKLESVNDAISQERIKLDAERQRIQGSIDAIGKIKIPEVKTDPFEKTKQKLAESYDAYFRLTKQTITSKNQRGQTETDTRYGLIGRAAQQKLGTFEGSYQELVKGLDSGDLQKARNTWESFKKTTQETLRYLETLNFRDTDIEQAVANFASSARNSYGGVISSLKQKGEALKGQVQQLKADLIDSGIDFGPSFQKIFDSIDEKLAAGQFPQIQKLFQDLSRKLSNEVLNLQSELSSLTESPELAERKDKLTAFLEKIQESADKLDTIDLSGLTENVAQAEQELESATQTAAEEIEQNFNQIEQAARSATQGSGGMIRETVGSAQEISGITSEISGLANQFLRFTTIEGIFNLLSRAVRSAFESVKELDEAMNAIAVVTDQTTGALWDQIDAYTALANRTGSTIKGAYEVAQLYYQQGLQTNDVLIATEETLKMARIAQIDYADATDYATSAIKGFNLAYTDLAHINDVYSNLAAHTASDTQEIAIAMSKVASIAHSTGMELETTAGFLAQIIATTRESPETAGTSLKTVLARFTEVKKLISEGETIGTDEEGEEVDVNKIETGLKSIGVQLRDASGQMRDMDDILIELSQKWASLDSLTQRYIATLAAGSRQQSRFLAAISDYDSLMETMSYALDAQGASAEQFAKTTDSLESKLNNLSNAWTQFTTGIANQNVIKSVVDLLTQLMNVVNTLTKGTGGLDSTIMKLATTFGALRLGGGAVRSLLIGLGVPDVTGGLKETWQSGGIASIVQGVKAKSAQKQNLQAAVNAAEVRVQRAQAFQQQIVANGRNAALATNYVDAANESLLKAKQAADAAKTGIIGFYQSLSTAGKILMGLGIFTAIVGGLIGIYRWTQRNKKAWEEYKESLSNTETTISGIEDNITSVTDALDGYTEIVDGQARQIKDIDALVSGTDLLGKNISLSADEFARYEDIVNNLVAAGFGESVEDVNKKLHGQVGELQSATEKLQAYNDELKEQRRFEAQSSWVDFVDSGWGSGSALEGAIEKINEESAKKRSFNIEVLDQVAKRWNEVNNAAVIENIGQTSNVWITNAEDITSALKILREERAKLVEELNKTTDIKDASSLKKLIQEIDNSITSLTQKETEWAKLDLVIDQEFQSIREAYKNFAIGAGWDDALDIDAFVNAFFDKDAFLKATDEQKQEMLDLLQQQLQATINAEITVDPILKLNEEAATLSVDEYYEKLLEILKTEYEKYRTQMGEAAVPFEDWAKGFGYKTFEERSQEYWDTFGAGAQGSISGEIGGIGKEGVDKYKVATTLGQLTDEENKFLTTHQSEFLQAVNAQGDSFQWEAEQISEVIKQLQKMDRISKTDLVEMSKDAREFGEAIADIDLSEIEIGADGKILDSEKFEEEYQELLAAAEEFTEDYSDTLSDFGELTGLDMTAEGLANLAVQAEAAGMAMDEYALAKMGASNILITPSDGSLNADAIGAMSAAASWWEADAAKAAYYDDPINGTYRGMSGSTLLKYSQQMAGIAALKGISAGRRSGGGGGGGGGSTAKPSQEMFYNYERSVERLTDALEELALKFEMATDPAVMKENIEAQLVEYQKLIGTTKSYIRATDEALADMRSKGEKFSSYVRILSDGTLSLTNSYYSATGEIVAEMDDWISAYNDILSKQKDLNKEQLEYEKTLREMWKEWRESYLDIEEQIAEALQEQDEKALEDKQEYYEKLEEMSNDYLDAVRKNIEAERRARDRANQYEDLEKKQRRLSLLQRDTSGRYAIEIAQLQEEIAQQQQSIADQEVDDILDKLDEQNEEENKRHSETLKLMEKQIQTNVETRAYIQQAQEVIAQGEEAIIAVLSGTRDYQEASDIAREKMLEEWRGQFAQLQMFLENRDLETFIKEQVTSPIVNAMANIRQAVGSYSYTSSSGDGGGDRVIENPQQQPTGSDSAPLIYDRSKYTLMSANVSNNGSGWRWVLVLYDSINKRNTEFSGQKNSAAEAKKALNDMLESKTGTRYYAGYKKGGLVDYTGPAWVDGTKTSPEAFLNQSQTNLFRNLAAILEKIPLKLFNHTPQQETAATTINIQIDNLGTDYDIDKAIQKVKDEIVRSTASRNINITRRGL